MGYWAGVISAEDFASERLYANDALSFPPTEGPAAGDQVVLVALTEPRVAFGVGRVAFTSPTVAVRYTYRLFDAPVAVDLDRPLGLSRLTRAGFDELSLAAPTLHREEWFVSVALPIEASSRAEAVREFWTYVDKLGPRELPAFVWPRGDELAMQAFVLGEIANQDPEEDDDED